MKKISKTTRDISLFLLLSCGFIPSAFACTGLKIRTKDGLAVSGRTVEFATKIDFSVAVIPRGYAFQGTTPNGKGLEYEAKHATVGVITFDNPAVMDGINEKGLAVGTFYFPGFAGYSKITEENQKKALSPIEFSNWLITQFATIDEVKAALSEVVIAPTINKEWGKTPPPFHYVVYDKSGSSLVIEPIDGKLVTYDNPLGTFTNSPQFDWHMTNLRNYINLKMENPKPLTIDGVTFSSFGQGGGMVGLPGDFTPPSRFVRAALFSSSAIPSANSKEAIFQVFHLLNQFDIPIGSVRENVSDVVYMDNTMFTAARDPNSLIYYFRTYDDQTIRFVDLKAFDPQAKTLKTFNTAKGVQKAFDISSELK